MTTPASPYQKTQNLYWFARLVDKIKLKKTGRLPEPYFPNLGVGHDEQCLLFLGIKYPDLITQVEQGCTDDELLAWAYQNGNRPTDLQILYWNEYMRKRGWRDDGTPIGARFLVVKEQLGLKERADLVTFFDLFEVDEGRKP